MKKIVIIGCFGVLYFVAWSLFRTDEDLTRTSSSPEEGASNHSISTQSSSAESVSQHRPSRSVSRRPVLSAFNQSEALLQNDPSDPIQLSEEVELLKNLEQSEQLAMNQIFILLNSMRGIANQGYYQTGGNLEVTNSLLGENYRKIAYLPEGHARINQLGELTDKWGTPYDFHFLSSKDVEVRSAGPDGKIYTDDDIELEVQ